MAKLTLSKKTRGIVSDSKKTDVASVFLSNLRRTIEIVDKQNTREPSATFSPSSMKCKRQCYYKILSYPTTEEVRDYTSVYITNMGSTSHDNIQHYIEKMAENGINCEYIDVGKYVTENKIPNIEVVGKQGMETKLYNTKYNISFLCDGILRIDDEYYIYEHKSEVSFKHNKRMFVDEIHYNQAYTYSMCLGIDKVIFTYENRDFGTLKSYLLEVTDENRQYIIDFIKETQNYVDKEIVPIKEDIPNNVCQYCKYQEFCKKDGVGGIEVIKEKPKRQNKRRKLI